MVKSKQEEGLFEADAKLNGPASDPLSQIVMLVLQPDCAMASFAPKNEINTMKKILKCNFIFFRIYALSPLKRVSNCRTLEVKLQPTESITCFLPPLHFDNQLDVENWEQLVSLPP